MTHISYSEFKIWKECPWRHKLQYVEKLKGFQRRALADAVGVEPLSARRPTKGQRTAWEQEIIKRESENENRKTS